MDRPLLKLTRLQIRKYRDAAPTELHFGPGHNVLIGRNGTGKTNLLKLITSVVRGWLEPLAQEEFDIAWSLSLGDVSVDVSARQLREDTPGGDRVGPLPDGALAQFAWVHEVTLRSGSGRGWHARLDASGARITPPEGEEVSTGPEHAGGYQMMPLSVLWDLVKFGSTDPHTAPDFLSMAFTTIEVYRTGRLDEGLDAFRWMTEGTYGEFGPGPAPPRTGWERPDKIPTFTSTMTPTLVELVRDRLKNAASPANLRFDRRELRFAETFCQLTGFADLYTIPIVVEYQEGVSASFRCLRFEAKLTSGLVVSQDRLSYGQRRLLAFLYMLEACPDVLIADELVNGFHHTWLEEAMKLLEGRQTFLTSQNPLLLDHLAFETVEDVAHTFVLCRGAAAPGDAPWTWRHPSEDEARALKSAYDVGIQHVGELLQVHGLW